MVAENKGALCIQAKQRHLLVDGCTGRSASPKQEPVRGNAGQRDSPDPERAASCECGLLSDHKQGCFIVEHNARTYGVLSSKVLRDFALQIHRKMGWKVLSWCQRILKSMQFLNNTHFHKLF